MATGELAQPEPGKFSVHGEAFRRALGSYAKLGHGEHPEDRLRRFAGSYKLRLTEHPSVMGTAAMPEPELAQPQGEEIVLL